MATKLLATPEEYLTMGFDGPDCEYLEGEIVERAMPDYVHGEIQARFVEIVYELKTQHPLRAVTEVRHRLAAARYRIPDVAIHYGPKPAERVPTTPPLVAIEIVSADDRYTNMVKKLQEYEAWGVPNIWVVDPEERSLAIFRQGKLEPAAVLEITALGITITPAQIFN